MPQKVLRFTGINRRVSEFQSNGACEELINLRPTASGLEVVKNKKNTDYTTGLPIRKVISHQFGSIDNVIAITDNAVVWLSNTGSILQTLYSGLADEVAYAGNVVVIKANDGGQKVFKYTEGTYAEFSVSIPSISIDVELAGFGASVTYTDTSTNQTKESAQETLSYAFSTFYNTYTHGLAGPIVVGCTFELEDGSEVFSSGFSIIDPTKDANFVAATCTGLTATVHGAGEARLKFNIQNFSADSGIKNIKFYSSIPVAPYEIDDSGATFYPKKVSNKDLNLAGQKMYLQKVMSYRRLGEFRLDTQHKQAAEELMPVTSGPIYRTGDVVSYNNRFHYFNSSVNHILQTGSYGVHSNRELPAESNYVDIRKGKLYVVINNGEEKIIVSNSGTIDIQVNSSMDFVYPMGGIKEGYLETWDTSSPNTKIWYALEFEDSAAYNYSVALDYNIWTPVSAPNLTGVIEAHGQSVHWKSESNAINVSAQFNPFVFPVEYSYSVSGRIIDLATSYLPISSTQVGQYPITIFATSGIYALEQGSGNVLYGKITPLQPMVTDGKAASSPYGTFYISSNSVYLLSGRESVNISEILTGERELNLRNNESYKALCCKNSGMFRDFSHLLSDSDFEEFVVGATLAYDQLHSELYISSAAKNYSYVFNMNTKSIHKVGKKYISPANGSRYIVEITGDSRRVVDMHAETKGEQQVLLQSRPMPLEMLFTHIQRMILLVDTKLEDSQHLCLSVFGSDNLHDWKCIISSQKHDAILRHIRTNKAAKSYRDYIILINGYVSTDTDISDLIADYTVVNRRLG